LADIIKLRLKRGQKSARTGSQFAEAQLSNRLLEDGESPASRSIRHKLVAANDSSAISRCWSPNDELLRCSRNEIIPNQIITSATVGARATAGSIFTGRRLRRQGGHRAASNRHRALARRTSAERRGEGRGRIDRSGSLTSSALQSALSFVPAR